jgi:hypothetical protein
VSLGRRVSAPVGEAGARAYAWLTEAGKRNAGDEAALAQYIGECRRMRWTWKLTAAALGLTPGRAARIWQRDLERRGLA